MTPTAIVAYLTLFIMVGVIFLVVALLLGRLFRPVSPTEEKSQAYECGEPPVGSSFVQFDLRFYVVALLFIVFEVELAFFFPPAVVFGKLTQILSPHCGPEYSGGRNRASIGGKRTVSGRAGKISRTRHPPPYACANCGVGICRPGSWPPRQ